MKLSVCIPVYKVERFVEKCARSLFEQTLEDMEFVCVDDCSPNRSVEILRRVLEDYPKRKGQVKFLRKTSIDELPQLFNVFRGEMALVGPRPIVEREIPYYGKSYSLFTVRLPPSV